MIKIKTTIFSVIAAFTLVFLFGFSSAEEPVRPNVDSTFDAKKEAKIKSLKGLPLEEAFEKLEDTDFFLHQDMLNKAIFTAFKERIGEAIAYSIELLQLPSTEIVSGQIQRCPDFYVARQVLRVFPNRSLPSLVKLYRTADPITRGNIIVVVGKMAGGKEIRNLLIEALDDKTICQEQYPEFIEEPLRICDEAYNQFVFRYKLYKKKEGLKLIGDIHSTEVRDQQIEILKSRL